MALELEFCDHCRKIIPTSQIAHIWRQAVVCDTCNQILRSVTFKAPAAGDSMARGMALPPRTPRHMSRERATRCNHCRRLMPHNTDTCPACKRATVKSFMDILPL